MMRIPGRNRFLVHLIVIAIFSCARASTQTIVVTSLDDSGPGTLRELVANAGDGAVIMFDPTLKGEIVLETRIWIEHNLTIVGPPSSSLQIVGLNYIRQSNSAPLLGIDTLKTVILRRLVLVGGAEGTVPGGGGIYNRGTLYLDTCEVSDCSLYGWLTPGFTMHGSGVYNSGLLIASASRFSRNTFQGLYNSGSAQLKDCTFSGNTGMGAGINNVGTLEAQGCAFAGNSNTAIDPHDGTTIPARGGAISNSGTAALVNCTLSGNSAFVVEGIATGPVVGSYYYYAPAYGGGIYNSALGKLSLVYCTVTDNRADFPAIDHGNASDGGGIFNDGGELNLLNTIVARNTGGEPARDIAGRTTLAIHSLIGELAYPDSLVTLPSNNNLFGSPDQPLNPMLDVFAEHGGETPVWSLASGSPAINGALSVDSVTIDQRGYTRTISTDIGAYEHDPAFSTIPQTVSLISPITNTTISPDTSIFVWSRSVGATSYRISVALDSQFASVVEDLSGIANRSIQTPALPGDARLYWRVRGTSSLGDGQWSGVGPFLTGHKLFIPDSIQILGPDSAVYHTMYITFRWRTARNAESYHVRLQRYDSYGILQTVSEVPQCPDTAITLGVAVSNWQYLLTVYGANAEATGRTTTLTVRTADIPPPVPPSLQFPPDSALVPTAVILRWADSRQNTYDSGFELQAVTDTVGAGTYHMWSGHDPECDPGSRYFSFPVGQTFFWRVRTKVEGRSGNYSLWRRFTVSTEQLQPPRLLAPLSGTEALQLPITLTWSPQPQARSFHVQVSAAASFDSLVFDRVLDGSQTGCTVSNLRSSGVYYWKVVVTSSSGTVEESAIANFAIEGLSPAQVTLEQNYPNPFNPTTRILYSVPGAMHVTLKLYNTLGEEVRTLVNQDVGAGWHEVVVDAKGLASGLYFYRLKTPGFVQTRRLICVR